MQSGAGSLAQTSGQGDRKLWAGRTAPWPCQRQAWGGHNQRLPKILPDPSRAECGQSVWAELRPSPGRRPQLAPRRPAPSPGPVAGASSRSGLLQAWRHAGSARHRVRVSLMGAGRTAVAPRWAGCVCAHARKGSPLGRPGANSPNLLPTGGRRLALAKGPVEGLPDAALTVPRGGGSSLPSSPRAPRRFSRPLPRPLRSLAAPETRATVPRGGLAVLGNAADGAGRRRPLQLYAGL